MTHFALDTETLGLNSRSPIISFAMTQFFLDSEEEFVVENISVAIEAYDKFKDKFELDYSTVAWQLARPQGDFNSVFTSSDMVYSKLEEFAFCVNDIFRRIERQVGAKEYTIWTHVDFDVPLIRHLLTVFGYVHTYEMVRRRFGDIYSIMSQTETGYNDARENPGLRQLKKHVAVDDALFYGRVARHALLKGLK